jgi:hypothetical protein
MIVKLVPFKVISLASFRENRPQVEIGNERRYVAEDASQFNGPSPVSYSCSVDIARLALAVSNYKRNPTGSGNRQQVATPSGSNLTVLWVGLDLLLCKHSSPSIYQRIYKSRKRTGSGNQW